MIQYINPAYILTVIGAGYVLTQSDIAKPLRMKVSKARDNIKNKPVKWLVDKLDGIVNCIYCASFWIGMALYSLIYQEISFNLIFQPLIVMGFLYVIKTAFTKN